MVRDCPVRSCHAGSGGIYSRCARPANLKHSRGVVMPDYRNKGIEIADKMLDPAIVGWLKSVQGGKGLDSAIAEVALDFAFGAVWARPNLSMDKRSAVVLGILIATNQGDELKVHLG